MGLIFSMSISPNSSWMWRMSYPRVDTIKVTPWCLFSVREKPRSNRSKRWRVQRVPPGLRVLCGIRSMRFRALLASSSGFCFCSDRPSWAFVGIFQWRGLSQGKSRCGKLRPYENVPCALWRFSDSWHVWFRNPLKKILYAAAGLGASPQRTVFSSHAQIGGV